MLQPAHGGSNGRPSGAAAGADARASEPMIGRVQPASRGAGMLRLLARGLAGLVTLIGACRRSRRSQRLAALSDHVLTDIGMRRADLQALVYARAPLARIKPSRADNVAALDRHRAAQLDARPRLVVDNDALDPAA